MLNPGKHVYIVRYGRPQPQNTDSQQQQQHSLNASFGRILIGIHGNIHTIVGLMGETKSFNVFSWKKHVFLSISLFETVLLKFCWKNTVFQFIL